MSGFHWAMSSHSYFDFVSVDYQTCHCNISQLLMWYFLLQNCGSKPTIFHKKQFSESKCACHFSKLLQDLKLSPEAPISEAYQPRNDHWKSWSPWKTDFFSTTFGHSQMIQSIWVLTIRNPFTNLVFFSASKSAFNVASCFSVSAISYKKIGGKRLSGNRPYILVYIDPLLTYLLASVPSILTSR